ncbi:MAG TPA: HEAT repeat domain-containing protein [Solirubrobacteraceae bacterium]|nr:HEAT repeat domain-containing protein [Solirubrobacteraceae bacterium]
MNDDELQKRLRSLLREDPVPEVRREAARAVGAFDDAAAVDTLVAALDDDNVTVRRAAIIALGRAPHERARAALIDALTSHPELWQETSAALATAGTPELISQLQPLLEHPSTHVRCGAIRALASLRTREVDREPLFFYEDDEGHRHPLF